MKNIILRLQAVIVNTSRWKAVDRAPLYIDSKKKHFAYVNRQKVLRTHILFSFPINTACLKSYKGWEKKTKWNLSTPKTDSWIKHERSSYKFVFSVDVE